jgi:hypothetical protein
VPLYEVGPSAIRANLESLAAGIRVRPVAIGSLTEAQLADINKEKEASGYPPIVAEVLFLGRHIHEGRILRDGYTIDDVIDQIASGMDESSQHLCNPGGMTAIQNPVRREDCYGNKVQDRIILECSSRDPRAEVFTVVPKGDANKPKMKRPPTKRERPKVPTARPDNILPPAHQPSLK